MGYKQILSIKEKISIKRDVMPIEDLRSKKLMSNVLETRLARQKRKILRINAQAEKKIKNSFYAFERGSVITFKISGGKMMIAKVVLFYCLPESLVHYLTYCLFCW